MKSLFALLLFYALSVHGADFPPFTAGKGTVQFTALPQQAEATEVKWRMHSLEDPAAIDLAKDKFQIIVPATYRHSER
jgi:hypothetical protein